MKNKLAKNIVIASLLTMTSGVVIADKKSVADLNGDGMVSQAELTSFVEMHFLKMDKDNDHMLDAKEAKELEAIFDVDHS